ncbi:pantoate--beta-alanine ligase [soil metagenome]
MIIEKTVSGLQQKLHEMRADKLKIGFVPTMGALHQGHISLVERAKKENNKVVVSIFVNPTQFNNPEDLKKYPRMPEKDFEMLRNAGADLIFFPDENEMYPTGKGGKQDFDFGKLEEVMEGKFRPGHFKGVGQVVSRLFEIVDADKAYFGEKDFQQLAVIRELVRQKKFRVHIKGCPTVREPDGLAMSSRNLLLTTEMRVEATKISQALFYIRDHMKTKSIASLKADAILLIERTGKLKVEYLEVADEQTLEPVDALIATKKYRCLTAVQSGNIRLIDNVQL